ncbi:TetR family transcriptional regulator C-terminal domain-containing protein [Levilactobacillus brevis]|nr:TetR family transcriptional regulator C-terminal domain-containing protein [Levilactobacillus brevis]
MTTGAVLSILQEWLDSGKQESPAELVAVMQEQVMPTLQRSQFRL